ncbi:hypothetical protein HK101_004868, partial [Irineochytrium annulatum]
MAIWQQAEAGDSLTPPVFFKIMKLIALCQNQKPVSLQFITTKTPLPTFDGVTLPAPQPQQQSTPPAAARTLTPISPQVTGSAGASGALFTQAEAQRFIAAFESCSPVDGYVTGEAARELFVKSGLSNDILGSIWVLVQTTGAMKLNINEFVCAMYLIVRIKTGILPSVPASIPAPLWSAISAATGVPPPGTTATPPATPAPAVAQPQTPPAIQTTSTTPQIAGVTAFGGFGSPTMTRPPSTFASPTKPGGFLPPPPGSGSPGVDRRKSVMAAGRSPSLGGPLSNSGAFATPQVQPPPPMPPMPTPQQGEEWAVQTDSAYKYFDGLDKGKKGFVS